MSSRWSGYSLQLHILLIVVWLPSHEGVVGWWQEVEGVVDRLGSRTDHRVVHVCSCVGRVLRIRMRDTMVWHLQWRRIGGVLCYASQHPLSCMISSGKGTATNAGILMCEMGNRYARKRVLVVYNR